MQRRAFLASLLSLPLLPHAVAGEDKVRIAQFNDAGQPLGTAWLAKVRRDSVWRQTLSPLAYHVTREAGTERAFSQPGYNRHESGLYRCICCDNALFDARTKFDSGTGWPSFWQPIAAGNVLETRDSSLFMVRTAVSCTLCDAHLGHVFDDGPQPTGLRYCMNMVALRFIPREKA